MNRNRDLLSNAKVLSVICDRGFSQFFLSSKELIDEDHRGAIWACLSKIPGANTQHTNPYTIQEIFYRQSVNGGRLFARGLIWCAEWTSSSLDRCAAHTRKTLWFLFLMRSNDGSRVSIIRTNIPTGCVCLTPPSPGSCILDDVTSFESASTANRYKRI